VLQYPVGPYRLDMAYPTIRLAVEYDGRAHDPDLEMLIVPRSP
jgi:very-short-patch-repair endonuclease